jgi:hypothetical protein
MVADENPDGDRLASAVATLTGLPETKFLRHPFLAERLVLSRALLRQRLAWCPECLGQWSSEGRPLFFPLLWAFKPVVCCPQHGVPLVTGCDTCGHQFRHVATRAWGKECPACGADLPPASDRPLPDWDLLVARAMHDLLEWSARLDHSVDDFLGPNLRVAASVVGGYAALGRFLGVSAHNVETWFHRSPSHPGISAVIRATLAFGIPPGQWLSSPLTTDLFAQFRFVPTAIPCLAPHRKYFSRAQIEPHLRAALADLPPRSVEALARSLGTTNNNLRAYFPELCAQLSARYKRFTSLNRLRKDSHRAALVREAMAFFKAATQPFRASQAKRFLGSRWPESDLHLIMVYRRILANDPAYALTPDQVPEFIP